MPTVPPSWLPRRVLRLAWRSTVALALVLGPLLLTPRAPLLATTSAPSVAPSGGIIPATGGADLSLDDTAAAGGNNVATPLNGPAYEEQASGDIGAGRITLRPPDGFAFDANAIVTVTVTPAAGASCPPGSFSATWVNFSDRAIATVSPTALHVNVSQASSGADRCKLTWSGIRVRQTGTAPVTGSLTTAPGGALLTGNVSGVTPWGSLSSVPGQHDRLVWGVQPSGGAAGVPWPVQPVIESHDRFGNRRTNDAASQITLALAPGSGVSGASLTCTDGLARTVEQGVARFAGCAIDLPGSGYRLRASSGQPADSDSAAFNVGAGPAARLQVAVQPAGASGGSPFTTQPRIHVTDAGGNLITSDSVTTVSAALLGGPEAGGRLLGTTTATASSGIVRFTDLGVDRAGAGYRLRLTPDSGAVPVESDAFSVAVGPPHAVQRISGDGQTGQPGAPLAQPLVAAVVDRGGNPVAGAPVGWELAGAAGPGAALQPGGGNPATGTDGRTSAALTLGAEPGAYTVRVGCPACPPPDAAAVFTATASLLPAITSVNPAARGQGAAAEVVILGSGFQPGSAVAFDGGGITVSSVRVDGTDQLTVNLAVEPGAAVGPRTVTVSSAGSVVAQAGAFSVTAAPTVSAVQPATLLPGQPDQGITITGSGFATGVMATLGGQGEPLAVSNVIVESAGLLRATVAVPDGAAPGLRTVTMVNPDGGQSTSGPAVSLPGALAATALALTTAMPGAVTSAELAFITAQAVARDGSIVLTFPLETGPATATLVTATIDSAACPGLRAVASGREMTITLDAGPEDCAVNAGVTVRLFLSGIVNPGVGGSYTVAMETRTAGGLVLDRGTVAAVLAGFPTPTPTATPARTSGGGGGGGGGSSSQRTPTPTPSPTPTPAPLLPGADLPAPPVQATRAVVSTSRSDRVSAGSVSIEIPVRAAGSGSSTITITVDPLSLADGVVAGMMDQAATQPAAHPLEGFAAGTLAFRVEMRDSSGRRVAQLAKPLRLTVAYGREDLRLGGGSAAGIELHRLDEVSGAWIPLDNQQRDPTAGLIAAESLKVGSFALMVEVPPPGISGPPDGAVAVDLAPVLAWTPPATATWHQVQVVPVNNDGPALNLIIGDAAAVAAGRYAVLPPQFGAGPYHMLPGMSYLWRVRTSTSLLPVGEDSPGWSRWQGRSFRTGAPTSATITLQNPPHDSTADSLTPRVQWADGNDRIFYYEVQVSRDPVFETDPARATAAVYWNLVHGGMTAPPNSYVIPPNAPLEPGSVYYWRIRPRVQGDGMPVAWTPAAAFRTP